MYKVLKKDTNKKAALEPRWLEGMYLGVMERTGECVIMELVTGDAVKCRDVKRVAEGLRFDKAKLDVLRATTWQPKTGNATLEPSAATRPFEIDGQNFKKTPSDAPAVRRFYVTEALTEKYGTTPGCLRCGGKRGPHSEECRDRILRRIQLDPDQKEKYDGRQTVEKEYEDAGVVPPKPPAATTTATDMDAGIPAPGQPGPVTADASGHGSRGQEPKDSRILGGDEPQIEPSSKRVRMNTGAPAPVIVTDRCRWRQGDEHRDQ